MTFQTTGVAKQLASATQAYPLAPSLLSRKYNLDPKNDVPPKRDPIRTTGPDIKGIIPDKGPEKVTFPNTHTHTQIENTICCPFVFCKFNTTSTMTMVWSKLYFKSVFLHLNCLFKSLDTPINALWITKSLNVWRAVFSTNSKINCITYFTLLHFHPIPIID